MNDKKPSIKLFTWKRIVIAGVVAVLVVANSLYSEYKLKCYLDWNDLISAILPITIIIAIFVYVAFRANRHKEKK